MKHRATTVAAVVMGIVAMAASWHFFVSRYEIRPALGPPAVPRAADIDPPPVINPFGTAVSLPKEISADNFAKMVDAFSEAGGHFMYENHLSNERSYQEPIPSLVKAVKPGGVYLGVGPEQNFTYIAAIRPAIAFIFDIRRQNMLELLMYKALFAMSANRVEFVSRLFSRKPSITLNNYSTVEDLFHAFADSPPDSIAVQNNLQEIQSRLQLSPEDRKTVENVYRVFFSVGPDLSYSSTSAYAPSGPTYANLMTITDASGRNWSYLSSEENFLYVKEMQRKNLIVPLVGDFTGPKAIRSVARYLKDHQATVSAFYVSNVEMYILAAQQWKNFCGNVATLPLDQSSVFIRFLIGPHARAFSNGFGPRNLSVISPMIDVLTGVAKGYPPSYYDLIYASRL